MTTGTPAITDRTSGRTAVIAWLRRTRETQLAQHTVIQTTCLRIRANEIEVSRADR
jgi:hypothetical protein